MWLLSVAVALAMAVRAVGGEERFRDEWLVNVDREVAEGFARLGIMG